MDNAVALVRAYLQLNGYFTITEYPVVRRTGDGSFRTLTEVDVAAFRLPGGEPDFEPDPALKVPPDQADLIIGEVKEGRAMINDAATDPNVIAKVLKRFGCSSDAEAHRAARELLAKGATESQAGHRVRLLAFGATPNEVPGPYLTVLLSDVVSYVDRYIAANWELVRSSGSRDPVFGVMVLLAKARTSQPAGDGRRARR
jgi:hypothetical protein